MKTSELFMDVFADIHGAAGINCQFCGRVHFSHMDEKVDELRVKAIAEPLKYMEDVENDTVAWGYLDGRQYVWHCPCDSGSRYEAFIWAHRERITTYLKKRAAEELQAAQRTLEEVQ